LTDINPRSFSHGGTAPCAALILKPVETFDVNVLGTANVLEACRNCDSVRAVVNITATSVMRTGNGSGVIARNDPMGGYDPTALPRAALSL
jgi:CDP-glucose 4,6-dehydratase